MKESEKYFRILNLLKDIYKSEPVFLKIMTIVDTHGNYEINFYLNVRGIEQAYFTSLNQLEEFVEEIHKRHVGNEWTVDRLLSSGGI